jgi:hypothetical protein
MAVVKTSPNTYIVGEGPAIEALAAASATAKDCFNYGEVKSVKAPGEDKNVEIMTWGDANDLPQQRELLVAANNVVPALLQKKAHIILGQELYAFTTTYEAGPDGAMRKVIREVPIPPEAQAWMDGEGWGHNSNLQQELSVAAGEYVKHELIVPEFIRSADGKIASLKVHEGKYLRAEKKNNLGVIRNWYWSGHWPSKNGSKKKSTLEQQKTITLPVYTNEADEQPRFITPMGNYLLNDGYYPIPSWWGGWEWIELANTIPNFHRYNIKNAFTPKWHIEMPVDYFVDYQAMERCTTDAETAQEVVKQSEREQQFINDINDILAGPTNAGRTIFTKYELDKQLGKDYPGIKIKPLQFDMKDEALLKLFERSNTANTSAQGIHPSLAGIETAGKLSSGTEIRNAFLMYLLINTPEPRRMLMNIVNLVKKVNGWPKEVQYGIRDYELTALSTDPSGKQERDTETSPTPTPA